MTDSSSVNIGAAEPHATPSQLSPGSGEPQPQSGQGETPVPEQFRSQDGGWDISKLYESYTQLQRRLTSQTQPGSPPDKGQQGSPKQITPQALSDFVSEYQQLGGHLTPGSLQRLEKDFGIHPDIAQSYMAGIQAQYRQYENDVMSEVGGKEAYQQMKEWAQTALSPQDKAVFTRQVESMDPDVARAAVRGLYAQYQGAQGQSPQQTVMASGPGGKKTYASWNQAVEAMSDPKYGIDPAYTNEVRERLMASENIDFVLNRAEPS